MDKIIEVSQNQPEKFPRLEKIELGSDGWLSPKGDYYKVGTTAHDESATFLVTSSDEVKREEKETFRIFPADKQEYDQRPNREKLIQLGWILIRGTILRSEDALNYTPEQLKKISDAGIKVVSAYEGSQEYSSKELIEKLNAIKDKLQRSQIINQVKNSLKGEAGESFKKRILDDMNDFVEDPLHKSIEVDEFPDYFIKYQKGGHEVLPSEIFNILSSGFSEEMVVSIGRYIRRYRVINLQGNKRLIVERSEYRHGGQSRDTNADIENNISMFVVEPHTILSKFERLILGGVAGDEKIPKFKLSKPDGYFAGIVERLVTS